MMFFTFTTNLVAKSPFLLAPKQIIFISGYEITTKTEVIMFNLY